LYSGVPTSGSMALASPMPATRCTSAMAASTFQVGIIPAQRKRGEREARRSCTQSL
jgi:hypothetical protein